MDKKSLLLFLLGIGIIAGISWFIGIRDIISEVSKLSFEWFLALLGIQLLILVLLAVKWQIVLHKTKVSFLNTLKASFVGYLANNITPIGIAGGEPVRAYLLHKIDKISIERSFASVVVDLFLHIFPLLFLIAIALIFAVKVGASVNISLFGATIKVAITIVLAIAAILLVSGFSAVIGLLLNKRYSMKIILFFIKILLKIPYLRNVESIRTAESRIDGIVSKFRKSLRMFANKFTLFFGTIVSLTIWLLSVFRMYLIFLALGFSSPNLLLIVLIVQLTVIAISSVPALPGAVGIWEGSSIALFALFGIGAALAAAVTIIDRVFSFWISSLIGGVSSVYVGAEKIMNGSRIEGYEELKY